MMFIELILEASLGNRYLKGDIVSMMTFLNSWLMLDFQCLLVCSFYVLYFQVHQWREMCKHCIKKFYLLMPPSCILSLNYLKKTLEMISSGLIWL